MNTSCLDISNQQRSFLYKGRGASIAPPNKFEKHYHEPLTMDLEYLLKDDESKSIPTRLIPVEAKSMINKVNSPDIPIEYSLNPYQGCEHGCSYCYARPTHEYWGLNAGIDFEQTVFYKINAVNVLRNELYVKKDAEPVMLSGNTDCYQPAERKLELTRKILKVFLEFNHPVCIVTKNALILRDLEILKNLAANNLVFVYVSINTIDEEIRRKMEPRTSSIANRFKILKTLSNNSIPCGVLIAPVIPALNNMHIPHILKSSWENGAMDAGYSVVRLNDIVSDIFKNWLFTHFPERAEKVWNLIAQLHGGKVEDKRFGVRMKGEGVMAEMIKQLFLINKNRYFRKKHFEFNKSLFKEKNLSNFQLNLF
ncbi:MAG: PA0069 family radical SAM protein [Bacteroidia bacterium]|nr:PA0069 family radical SAM protein [Bacteroidia bacterium]